MKGVVMLSVRAVNEIVQHVNWSDLPRAIAYAKFPVEDIPSSRWSLVNRVIMISAGTFDARGLGQWKAVQRYLIRGARPLFIVAPQVHHDKEQVETKEVLKGFVSPVVYAVGHTYGDPIEYKEPAKKQFNTIPLALRYKLDLKGINKFFPVSTYVDESLVLADELEKQFFWTLVLKVFDDLFQDGRSRKDRLLVAELSALALLYICGRNVMYCGNHFSMIQAYGRDVRLSTLAAFMTVVKNVDKVLSAVAEISVGELS